MKRSQIAFALLATIAAASNSVSLACEKCHSKSNSCKTCAKCDERACTKCDDRGLLDVVDLFAGRIQKSLEGTRINRGSKCDQGCDGRRAEPTCGCEPACGCETQHAAPLPVSVHQHGAVHDNGIWLEPEMPNIVPSPHNQTKTNPFDRQPRSNDSSIPTPKPVTKEGQVRPVPQQLPDEAVDPFIDDAASRVRRVPASPIQYQRPVPRSVDQFDPQAANRYRVRVGDTDSQPVRSRTGTQLSAFGNVQSSRRAGEVRSSLSDTKAPDVVTASNTSRLEPVRSTHAERLPSRAEVQSDENAYYANPLR